MRYCIKCEKELKGVPSEGSTDEAPVAGTVVEGGATMTTAIASPERCENCGEPVE
jgi:hypothetical protein